MGEKERKQNFIAKPKQPNTTYCPKEKCSDNVGQKRSADKNDWMTSQLENLQSQMTK